MFAIFILMIATVVQLGSFVEPTTIAPLDITTAGSDNPIEDINDPTAGWIETTLPESRNWSFSDVCPGQMLIRSFALGSSKVSAKLQQKPSTERTHDSSPESVTHGPMKSLSVIKFQCYAQRGQGSYGPESKFENSNSVSAQYEDYLECPNGGFTSYALQTPFSKARGSARQMSSTVINVKMMCSNEDEGELIGFPTNQGDWTPYANCNAGNGICGFKVVATTTNGHNEIQNVAVKCCPDILNLIGTGGPGGRSGRSGSTQKLFHPLITLPCLSLIFGIRYFI